MLSKEFLIKYSKEAYQNKSSLFITLENNKFKFYTKDKMYSGDFLDKYNLNYDNLIVGALPETILKYDYVVYYQQDMSIDTFIEEVNKRYFRN